jgi:hypothetical protein
MWNVVADMIFLNEWMRCRHVSQPIFGAGYGCLP